MQQRSDRLAAALLRRGVKSGDTALVQLGNVAEFYIVFFALLKIGVAPVNALFSHQRSELNAYAEQIKPALLIADRQHGLFADDQFLNAFRDAHPSLRVVALRSQPEGELALAAWLDEASDGFVAQPSAADQVAFFQLSGGSTSTPKLIPRTHNDYYYSIRRSVEICRFDAQTRYLCALPVAHNYPMSSPGVLGVFYGAGLVVFAADPDAGQCFRLIEQHQINVTALVPPAVTLWLQAIEEWGGNAQLASLKLLQVGGAKLGETLAARIQNEIGCQLQQVFGMAEGLVNYTRLDDDERHILTTQGRPMSPDDEVWVADDDGNPLPAGEVGRLMTRGPYTFRGYYQSPAHNADAFDADGFYCSGDLISISEDGYITVQGRQKDQINRGGEDRRRGDREPAAASSGRDQRRAGVDAGRADGGEELRLYHRQRAAEAGGAAPPPARAGRGGLQTAGSLYSGGQPAADPGRQSGQKTAAPAARRATTDSGSGRLIDGHSKT